ncbi:MAG: DUF1330 domain-containing protein [Deltaproteobacteria bacterium]|nr:DUF1330 domain-containing protein [Deltaproteobacteria bacterium]
MGTPDGKSARPLETPNPEALQAFAARATEGPVVMLNLLKFKPDGGREMYARYGAAVMPLLQKAGGRIVYAGEGTERLIGSTEWDSVLLVEYPTRQAFLDMVLSETYRAIQHLRDESLERSVLYATDPGGGATPSA